MIKTPAAEEDQKSLFTVTWINERQLELDSVDAVKVLSKENFEITGTYCDDYGEFVHIFEIQSLGYTPEGKILITGSNKFIKGFTYTVKYVTAETVPTVEAVFSVDTTEETTASTDKTRILFKNQEAIHIPFNASFADGTPLQNINDIARYAFSFMLSDGTPIIPTYDGNATGVADIAGVDYRAIEGASSVIVRSIYLKVYLDANNDGWVSAAEKAEDALGYYCIEVKVDKTLTVEDWSIVKQ